jgi:hypothetical protein
MLLILVGGPAGAADHQARGVPRVLGRPDHRRRALPRRRAGGGRGGGGDADRGGVQDLDGDRARSPPPPPRTLGTVPRADPSADLQRLLDDVKARVDAIDTFPAEAERADRPGGDAAPPGDQRRDLTATASRRRSSAWASGCATTCRRCRGSPRSSCPRRGRTRSRSRSPSALRRYGLTFARWPTRCAARRSTCRAGGLETEGGEILLRTEGQAYRGERVRAAAAAHPADGTRLRSATSRRSSTASPTPTRRHASTASGGAGAGLPGRRAERPGRGPAGRGVRRRRPRRGCRRASADHLAGRQQAS